MHVLREPMRIIVTGSRHWTDRRAFLLAMHGIVEQYAARGFDSQGRFVDWLAHDWTLVHGGCPTGIDALADDWAVGWFMNIEVYPAQWKVFGKAAGPKRNELMASHGADLCVAFPLGESRGTRHMMRAAEAAGIKVITPLEVRADGA
jgi:hypothetical protein